MLDKLSFRKYLLDHSEEMVGWTRVSVNCPVANYLKFITNEKWVVSPLCCKSMSFEFVPPNWVKHFIHHLDQVGDGESRPVNGLEALYVLDE